MSRILHDRSFRIAIVLTLVFFLTGIGFLLLGWADLNWILFLLLPIVLGVSIGALPNRLWALIGAGLATVTLLVGLLAFGFSGFICVVMVLPLIIPLIFLGSVITHLVVRYKRIASDKAPMLLLPLLLFIVAAPMGHYAGPQDKQVIEVRSERSYVYAPEAVYDAIKSVDTLDGEKPFLMYFDLPVPTKCVLEKEEVGGTRTCHFNGGNLSNGEFGGGTIVERITELERGRILRMDVTDYNLIGRKWLGFVEAIYRFEPLPGGQCKLVRITTYTSELTPRWYWEPLERLGIEQEHAYVFSNLQADLAAAVRPRPE